MENYDEQRYQAALKKAENFMTLFFTEYEIHG